jgi:hypothetical protein
MFTYTSASMVRATSRTRSDPLGHVDEVMTTGMPLSAQTAATSSESVATTTGSISPLSRAARHTHSTIGRPAISLSTFRASRVELSRAGITPAIRIELMQASLLYSAHRAGMLTAGASRPRVSFIDLSSAPPYHL